MLDSERGRVSCENDMFSKTSSDASSRTTSHTSRSRCGVVVNRRPSRCARGSCRFAPLARMVTHGVLSTRLSLAAAPQLRSGRQLALLRLRRYLISSDGTRIKSIPTSRTLLPRSTTSRMRLRLGSLSSRSRLLRDMSYQITPTHVTCSLLTRASRAVCCDVCCSCY
jgi:hypothetical protein